MSTGGGARPARLGAISLLARAAIAVSVVLFVILIAIQLWEAISRFFGVSTTGATEFTGILMAAGVLCAFPVVLATEPTIDMTLLYDRLHGLPRRLADHFRDLCVIAFFGLILWAAVPWAIDAAEIGEKRTGLIVIPIWPVKVLFAVSMGIALLISVIAWIRPGTFQAAAQPRTLPEGIKERTPL
jgi:TRAP-type C4-dicarboxylate transport system permease small subunit